MDRGGDSGTHDGFPEGNDPNDPEDPFASTSPGFTAPPGTQREWTHPSEVGLQARVHTDRRRGRALVIGLVAVGTVVMLGTAALTNVFDRQGSESRAAAPPGPLVDCLAMVEILDPTQSTHTTGLLIDEGHHVVVAGDGLHDAERIAVRIGGARTTGSVVARDSYADLAILRLAAPSGTRPDMAPDPDKGDTLRLVRFDDDGNRRSTNAHVSEVSLLWSRPDHTIAEDVITLSGESSDTGVLTGPDGTVSGLVIGDQDGQPVAYTASRLQQLVDQLMEHGTVEHPWIGVRVRDLADSGGFPTDAGARPAASIPTRGAEVAEVVAGSPAQDAGIRPGDVIYAVNDTTVTDMADLVGAVTTLSPGHVVTVSLLRDGEAVSTSVEVAAFPE